MNWSKAKTKSLSFLCLLLLITSVLATIAPQTALAKQSTGTTTEVGTQTNQSSAISDTVMPTEEEITSGRSEVYKVQPMDSSVIDNTEASRTDPVQEADSFDSQSAESKDGFKIKNKNGPFKASFAEKVGEKFLNFSYSNAELNLAPIGSASVKGEINNDKITYKKIYPETDLRYQLGSSNLKETIVVKKYTGKSTYDFSLTVANAVYQKNENGEIVFSSPLNGKGLFYLAKPFAVDSAGNRCDAASLDIIGDGTLRLSVDSAWLKNAVYPVMIDPTINLFDPTFARDSYAYKLDGSEVKSNAPRYETAKFGKGIMVEEPSKNLMANPSCSLEQNLPGWLGVGGVLSQSTSQYLQGSKSMQFVTSAAGDNYAYTFDTTPQIYVPIYSTVSPNTTYTYSAYVNIPMALTDGSTYLKVAEYAAGTFVREQWMPVGKSVTSGWEREVLTFTTSATTTKVNLRLCQSGIGTSYSDGFQLEQKPYPTTWVYTALGYGRKAETLSVPTSYTFNKNSWSVEMAYKNCYLSKVNNMFLWSIYIDANNYLSLYVKPTGSLCYAGKYGGTYFLIESAAGYVVPGNNHQIMITFDGTKVRLCCNGSQIGSDTTTGVLVGTLPTNMYFGSFKDGSVQADGIIDDVRISNRARSVAEYQSVYQLNKKLAVDASTTCKIEFENTLHALPDVNSVTPIFTRNSVAYDDYNDTIMNYAVESAANVPRFKTAKFGRGIMVEEGTGNALFESSSSMESGLGWSNSNPYTTIIQYTNMAWHGSACMKITTDTDHKSTYAYIGYMFNVMPNTTYTYSAHVLIPSTLSGGNTYLSIAEHNSSGNSVRSQSIPGINYTFTKWQREIMTFTTSPTTAKIMVFINQSGAGTSYVDGVQLEQKPYASSWTKGESGNARMAESLTIPTSTVFNPDNWSVEMTYIPTYPTNASPNTVKYLWHNYIDANNWYMLAVGWSGELVLRTLSNGTLYSIQGGSTVVGTPYSITACGDGVNLKLFVNGQQIGTSPYVKPIGALPTNMYIGCSCNADQQANGIIDDLRISGKARTLSEHQTAYQSGVALPIDFFTTCKINFDSSLPATVKEVSLLQYNYYNYGAANTLDKVILESQTNNTVKQYNFVYDANGNMTSRSAN